MNDCLFCKKIKGGIPTKFIYKDEDVAAFKDTHPLAPIHILIVPVKHIPSITEASESDAELLGKMVMVAKKIAQDMSIARDGYKLLFRVGKHGGQEIKHIHLHLIGGAQLSEDIHPVD